MQSIIKVFTDFALKRVLLLSSPNRVPGNTLL